MNRVRPVFQRCGQDRKCSPVCEATTLRKGRVRSKEPSAEKPHCFCACTPKKQPRSQATLREGRCLEGFKFDNDYQIIHSKNDMPDQIQIYSFRLLFCLFVKICVQICLASKHLYMNPQTASLQEILCKDRPAADHLKKEWPLE